MEHQELTFHQSNGTERKVNENNCQQKTCSGMQRSLEEGPSHYYFLNIIMEILGNVRRKINKKKNIVIGNGQKLVGSQAA